MNNFDWVYYINKYPDLQKIRIDNREKALYHYKKFGIKENRFPNKNAEINYNKPKNNNDNKIQDLEKKIELLNKEITQIKKIININQYNKTDSDDNYMDIIHYN